MSSVYSNAGQAAAMAAASAAENGSKATAFLESWQTSLGTNPTVNLYRNGTLVWSGEISGSVTIDSGKFKIETASQVSISAADIDTGTWECRLEKAGDSAVYVGGPVSKAGGENEFSLDGDLEDAGSLNIGTIYFAAPSLDTTLPEKVQSGSVVTGSDVSSMQLTLSTQPTDGNKVLVQFSLYEGFRGYDDPSDVSATLWLDFDDWSTLKQNTDGSGSVTAVGQLVRRITNKGSAGGYLTNSTGWYLRQDETGGYYLEMNGASEFVSSFASSAVLSVSAGEVIAACRPSSNNGYESDSWYAPAIWQADDGNAGVSFHSSSTCRFFNNDGTDDYVSGSQTQGDDQLFTWIHTGGNVKGAVGFSSDPATSGASGDTSSLAQAFSVGGVYHGSFPRLTGRLYGIVAKNSALTTTERAFVQWFLHRRMVGVGLMAPPAVTDNASNTYSLVHSASDAASRLLVGMFACHNVSSGSGTFTATLTMPGSHGWYGAAQISEWSGLIGASAVDQTGDATDDGSDGSLAVSTSATSHPVDLVVATFGLYNNDADANMTTPSGYAEIGVHDVANAVVGFHGSYKITSATGTQSATGTWDADSSGGAVGVLVALKSGVNTDPPSGGGGGDPPTGGTGEFNLNIVSGDVNTSLQHEYLMDGVNPSWSWGTYPRAGVGPNPPQASGWDSPAWIAWGHAGTERGNPPGSHNWRLAIHEMHSHEKRNGQWVVTHSPVTTTAQHSGAMYLDYETNESTPADRRTSNGYPEVKFPDAGGAYHWYPSFRTAISATGATHRAVLMRMSLTVDDAGEADDRASADVAALVGGDYWRSMSTQWGDGYSNDDFWIGRARKPALYPETSWHCAHTMTSEADMNEYIAWVESQGILE